jgi:hypothetical protein
MRGYRTSSPWTNLQRSSPTKLFDRLEFKYIFCSLFIQKFRSLLVILCFVLEYSTANLLYSILFEPTSLELQSNLQHLLCVLDAKSSEIPHVKPLGQFSSGRNHPCYRTDVHIWYLTMSTPGARLRLQGLRVWSKLQEEQGSRKIYLNYQKKDSAMSLMAIITWKARRS